MNDMLRRVAADAKAWAPIVAAHEGCECDPVEVVLEALTRTFAGLGVDAEIAYALAFAATADVFLDSPPQGA